MKTLTLILLAAALLAAGPARAAEKPAGEKDALPKPEGMEDFQALVGKIKAKLGAGQNTEDKLVEELKAFDEVVAKLKKSDVTMAAQAMVMKSALYLEVFNLPDKAIAIMKQIKVDFPDTEPGKKVEEMITMVQKRTETKALRAGMVKGGAFPDFSEKDIEGKPTTIAGFKGKVLLVDFWATWCGPCVAELPHVKAAYEKYHAKGFEVLGISLDQDLDTLKKFIAKEKMTWRQIFDEKNTLSDKYGVESIPSTFLLDGAGKIIATDLRGAALEEALAKALGGK